MPTNDIITSDLVQSQASPLVELFELILDPMEINPNTDATLFFTPGVEGDLTTIKFHPIGQTNKNTDSEANEYTAIPMEMSNVEGTSDGPGNRPSLTLANVTDELRSALDDESFTFEDLVGTRIRRRRTFAKYLVGGDDASSPYEFPEATYIVERIQLRSKTVIVLELAAPFDLEGVKLPGRLVVGKYCSWIYQGREEHGCGGCIFPSNSQMIDQNDRIQDVFFDLNDNPLVTNVSEGSWISTSTYAKDDFASYNSVTYQSKIAGNVGNTPGDNQYWRPVYKYTTYSSSTAYSVDAYVKYDNHIWKALKGSTGKTPNTSSVYWKRVDLCSKTLAGCKARFGYKAKADSTNSQPSVDQKKDIVLPFGAFPGSDKFK